MAKRGGKFGATVLLLAGLWLGLAGSRWALALTAASSAGALKRLHAGALKLKASSSEDVEREAKWLQKTAAEIKDFKADEVSSWVRAALEADNYGDKGQSITEILKQNDVRGTALLELTAEKMRTVGILMGPAEVLAKRIAAASAPPMAASGFQDDPEATEFIRELANATPQDLGEGVQVFNLTKSLPAKPYGQSGPKLLTRNTTRRAWQATFELMKGKAGTERVAMLGVPGIGKSRNLALGLWHLVTGQLPDGIPPPEAIVYEAREGGAVFLFTKGQDGWKAQSQQIEDWRASGCVYLKNASNWYLVDASDKRKTTFKLAAKTVVACSPDPEHYSNFVKDGECVFVEAFRWAEVEACYEQLETQVNREEMRQRFQQVGGALRTLLASDEGYSRAVKLQGVEVRDFTTVERALAGDLSTFAEKKMPTRLFTYLSADGISNSVTVCSPGAAALLVDEHYDKLVELWNAGKPESRYVLEECVGPLLTTFWPGKQGFAACEVTNAAQPAGKRAQWNRTPVNDFQLKEGLQLLECDTDQIFDDRWREAVKNGSLEGRVLHSPENYPGIDYLLDFNHGISVTTSLEHDIAKAFRDKLQKMFNAQPCSFTLTFLITGNPRRFKPKNRSDYDALRDMAGRGKLFDNVRVQVVQIPKTLNSLS